MKKNIVLFYCDQFLWNALGFAGHAQVNTPNLDKLASQGVYFPHTYSVSPVCVPARVSTFTGQYPHHTGVFTNTDRYTPGTEERFLTHVLQENGYHTCGIGKYHFINKTTSEYERELRRFDTVRLHEGGCSGSDYMDSLGAINSDLTNINLHGYPKEGTGGPVYGKDCLNNNKKIAGIIYGDSQLDKEHFYTEWVSQESIDYLEINHESPFFLYTSFVGPHSPFFVPEPYSTMYDPEEIELPESWQENHENEILAHAWQHQLYGTKYMSEKELRKITALYYGHITLIDEHIGRVIDKLDELGIRKNTIIAFSADHGELLGTHGLMYKGVMYDESLRVPLIISDAGQTKGRVSESLISQVDIMPTLLDMASVKVPGWCDGKSLKALMNGNDYDNRTEIFAEIAKGPNLGFIFGCRNKQYLFGLHIGLDSTSQTELYNMHDDPEQKYNIANDPANADLVEQFKNKIMLWHVGVK